MQARDNSDRVNGMFAGRSRDLTPAALRRDVQVLFVPVSDDPDVTRHCAAALSNTELQRAGRFAAQADKKLFIQRRAFRRFCGALALGSSRSFSQVNFSETENGRPYLACLPDYWFSFSSCCFGFVGAWSSTHGVGIDIEDQTRNLEATKLAQQFFMAGEARAVDEPGSLSSQQAFYQFWSLKEAALKSIGEGLPFGMDAFEFELEPDLRVVHAPASHGGPKQFEAHMIAGSEGCTALVIR